MQISRLSLFSGDGFSPQTQIGLGQSEQPFGQLRLHGQSEINHLEYHNYSQYYSLSSTVDTVCQRPSTLNQTVRITT